MANSQNAARHINKLLRDFYPKGQARHLEPEQIPAAIDALNELLSNDSALEEISNALIGPKQQLLRHFLIQVGEPSVYVLAFAAQSSDLSIRRRAYEIAGYIGESAIDLLITGVKDADFQVRQQIARSLCNYENDLTRDNLKTLAKDEVDDVRLQAIISLATFENPDCESLISYANDAYPPIRERVIQGLAQCGEAGLEVIQKALQDQKRSIRIQAIRSLALIGTPEVVPALENQIYENNHPQVKREAIYALGQVGEIALENLIQLTNNDDPQIKRDAVAALQFIGEPALEALGSALNDDAVDVRIVAAVSLSHIGPSAVEILSNALSDNDQRVKEAIISSLGRIGLPSLETISSIIENERDVKIQKNAVNVLAGLGEESIHALATALENEQPEVMEQAMNRLREFGKASLPVLPVALNSNHARLRRHALHTLEDIGIDAIEVLCNALDSPFEDVQENAAEILAHMGSPAINPLIYALQKDNPNVKLKAIWGLCSLGPQSLAHLLSLVEHADHYIRDNTLRAIFQIGIDESIANQVAKLLESQYGDVSSSIADNLAEVTSGSAYLAMGNAIIDELVIRSSDRQKGLFNSEVTSAALQKLMISSPPLRSLVLDRLAQLAFHNSGEIRERIVAIARIIFPHEFTQLVRARDTENPDAATDIMRLFGGNEAVYYLSEQQSSKLQQFREPLLDLEGISRKQWEELSQQTRRAFYLSMSMTGLLFVFGVGLVIMGAYLLFAAEDPALKVGGAITSGIISLGTLLSNRFWKDPVDHIRKYSAQQARLEAAFIGYMNRVSQIRFVFESESSSQGISLNSLEKYQAFLSEASSQASKELGTIEGGG